MEQGQHQVEPQPENLSAFKSSERLAARDQPATGFNGQAGNRAGRYRRIRSAAGRWGRQLWIYRCVQRLSWMIPMGKNAGICSFEICSAAGFFAQLTWCLWVFEYCELHNLVPDLRLTGLYRDANRAADWLGYYFDISGSIPAQDVANRVRYTKKLGDLREWGAPKLPELSIKEGSRLFNKYLHIKPHIAALVDEVWENLGVDGPVVGIHFRGNDKTEEAPRVSWERCLHALRNFLERNENIEAVFVASDEQEFISFVVNSIKDVHVCFHNDHYRSQRTGETAPYRVAGGGYEKGEDALVNALLLARCSTLIRTTSFLSAWASIFNPDLKIILLNRPYDRYLWYPEVEILKSPNTTYLPDESPHTI